jgi:hypothetical protein
VLAQPDFSVTAWDGVTRTLESGRKPKGGGEGFQELPAGWKWGAWKQAAGDAGWAAALAEIGKSGQVQSVVFPPGMDVLPLVAEALSLLEPSERWKVTFSTYHTKLPAGVNCQWRFLLAGTPEADALLRNPRSGAWDLTAKLGAAPETPLAQAARDGIAPPGWNARRQPKTTHAAAPAAEQGVDHAAPAALDNGATAGIGEPPRAGLPPRHVPVGRRVDYSAGLPLEPSEQKGRLTWLLPTCIAAVLAIALIVVLLLREPGQTPGESDVADGAGDSPTPTQRDQLRTPHLASSAANRTTTGGTSAHVGTNPRPVNPSPPDPITDPPMPLQPLNVGTTTDPPPTDPMPPMPKPRQPTTYLAAGQPVDFDLNRPEDAEALHDGDSLLVLPGARATVTLRNQVKLTFYGGSYVEFTKVQDAATEPKLQMTYGLLAVEGHGDASPAEMLELDIPDARSGGGKTEKVIVEVWPAVGGPFVRRHDPKSGPFGSEPKVLENHQQAAGRLAKLMAGQSFDPHLRLDEDARTTVAGVLKSSAGNSGAGIEKDRFAEHCLVHLHIADSPIPPLLRVLCDPKSDPDEAKNWARHLDALSAASRESLDRTNLREALGFYYADPEHADLLAERILSIPLRADDVKFLGNQLNKVIDVERYGSCGEQAGLILDELKADDALTRTVAYHILSLAKVDDAPKGAFDPINGPSSEVKREWAAWLKDKTIN